MTERVQNSLTTPVLHQSKLLRVSHGMFTRKNGGSPPPFFSLNLSFGVGDAVTHVIKNRQLVKKALDIDTLITSQQIHSDKIFCADAIEEDTEVEGYDALITSVPGTGLLIQQADCQAVLLHDPVKRVIGAIHCGWRGTVLNIISKTIESMNSRYGTNPAFMRAVISPSLGPCCSEFIHYERELPEPLHKYQVKPNYFDFWKISEDQLVAAGLQQKHIETMAVCTFCSLDFFSYRRSKKKGRQTTGRHGSAVCMKKKL